MLGSVQDQERVHEIMLRFGTETVYHAAAYKHVPMVEQNIIEGTCNNVLGTLNTARAAVAAGVKSFVLVSTDKAVSPTNVMGATKRLAEQVLQALQETTSATCFSIVRFGNVLESSGSVVPLFREQIKLGGPVTVTHPLIIRYFMTIPEAAQLVIQAGTMAEGGDVFVLDMGEPVKIVDLATRMINLTGLTVRDHNNPDGDIEIEFTGLRPAEKLYEELLIGENVSGTEHPRIMRAEEHFVPYEQLEGLLQGVPMLRGTWTGDGCERSSRWRSWNTSPRKASKTCFGMRRRQPNLPARFWTRSTDTASRAVPSSLRTLSSTRRFVARPPAVSLSAMGCDSP